MSLFKRYIGIDYSGAETPTARLAGLEVFQAADDADPTRVRTPAGPGWKWTRKEIAEWLAEQLAGGEPVIVGIDHGFSFPLSYFQRYGMASWDAFLDDFCRNWPADDDNVYVDFLKEGNARTGRPDEFRLTEKWTSSAKSVFAFGGPGRVAHATHAGLPWLRYLRTRVRPRPHFWPFDGFEIPVGRSAVVEVYPSILKNRYPAGGRNAHGQDAYAVARWLREIDQRAVLSRYCDPPLDDAERKQVCLEGWILGIV